MIKKLKWLSKKLIGGLLLYCLVMVAPIISEQAHDSYLYSHKGKSVVMLTSGRRGGTGFIIKAPSGIKYILTNKHICNINKLLTATDVNGVEWDSWVVKKFAGHDLCIIRSLMFLEQGHDTPHLSIAQKIAGHEKVWLIGHPGLRSLSFQSGHFAGEPDIKLMNGYPDKNGKCPSDSIVKKTDLFAGTVFAGAFQYLVCLKTMSTQYITAISYGGNSGSPVVNKWGSVVGVLFAGFRGQPTASYTVPLHEIHKFLKDK